MRAESRCVLLERHGKATEGQSFVLELVDGPALDIQPRTIVGISAIITGRKPDP